VRNFFRTLRRLKKGEDLTLLSGDELRERRLLNPWMFNFANMFIAGAIALGIIKILSFIMTFANIYLASNFQSNASPIGTLIYILLTSSLVALFSLSFSSFRDKQKRLKYIHLYLYTIGSNSVILRTFLSTALLAFLMFNINYRNLSNTALSSYYFMLIFTCIISIIYFIVAANEYFSSISVPQKWKESLKEIKYSPLKIEVFSALFFLCPFIAYIILMNIAGYPYLYMRLLQDDRIVMPWFIIIALLIFFYGWIIFIRCKKKLEIIKASILLALFLNLPGCASMSTHHEGIDTSNIKKFDYAKDIFTHLFKYFSEFFDYIPRSWVEIALIYICYIVLCIPFISTIYAVFSIFGKIIYRIKLYKTHNIIVISLVIVFYIVSIYNYDREKIFVDSDDSNIISMPNSNDGETIIQPNDKEDRKIEAHYPLLVTINFPDGGITLSDEAKEQLDKFISEIRNGTFKISIAGHTDILGSSEENLVIGERRARSVAFYLTQRGVAQNTLNMISYGNEQPKFDNATAEGRRLNRRVEIEVHPASSATSAQ
jgi:outer membrane protein OmpA-like peptidoglycan-associated protein